MKPQLNKLIKIRQEIIKTAETRDAKALSKSDKWQESQKGIKHENDTGHLADAVEALDEVIMELKKYLNEA
jgi:hypothetical protein